MFKKVIYPGTFDPITNGHIDIIERAVKLFDQVIVAIATNTKKQPLFSLLERKKLVETLARKHPDNKIKVCTYDGLLVDFARELDVMTILRGLRAVSDFEYEFQLAGMNRTMEPKFETIFLTPAEKYSYISASIVREIALLGGDVSQFVPKEVCVALKEKVESIG